MKHCDFDRFRRYRQFGSPQFPEPRRRHLMLDELRHGHASYQFRQMLSGFTSRSGFALRKRFAAVLRQAGTALTRAGELMERDWLAGAALIANE